MSTTKENKSAKKLDMEPYSALPLVRTNFICMIIAGALIVVGFCLMVGGGGDGKTFNPEVFSTTRIVIGPMLAFLGFVGMAIAIIIKPKSKHSVTE